MDSSEVRDRIKEMLAAILCVGRDEISETELLINCGINSVDLIDLVVKLEATFNVKFDPAAMRELTVNVLAENIERMQPLRA